jgi:glycosyltransferase involved in cell wall biosynthesis
LGSRTTPEFPTIAEDVASRATSRVARANERLVVVVENARDEARARQVVAGRAIVLTTEAEASDLGDGEREGVPRSGATVDDVVDAVRTSGVHALLVSDADRLTSELVQRMESVFEIDSACATVSVDDLVRTGIEGLPPPGIAAPRRGLVLVDRAHLLLAADEAEFTAGLDLGGSPTVPAVGVVGRVLELVDRPGFVHRAYGASATTRPAAVGPRQPTVGRGGAARIVIDGRCLESAVAGTQVQVLGLLNGLVRAGADLALLAPRELHPTVRTETERLSREMPFVDLTRLGRPDVFHRPYQVVSLDVLVECLGVGERFVLTQQDMILDRTRAYHRDVGGWEDYRRATQASLTSADAVGFFSRHAAMDAASDGGLDLDRATVVPLGVDHLADSDAPDASPDPLHGRPYLLVVGSSFWHKNRLFSMRLVRRLVESHGWDGGLVLVGGHPGRGSSVPAESLLRRSPSLDGRVVDLGHVAEVEQHALYRHAELVLFLSLYEGFGFIPFEAAALGTACVYARVSAMEELLPSDGALASFEVDEAAAFVAGLLERPAARARIVHEISSAARRLTWDRTAAGYLDVYERALATDENRVSRCLVEKVPPRRAVLATRSEEILVDVYRRRPVFRAAADLTIRTGMAARGLGRLVSRRPRA